MSSEETRRVLVTATLADPPPDSIQETTAAFQFIATGEDEQLSVTPDPEKPDVSPVPTEAGSEDGLASTGLSLQLWIIVVAAMLITVGVIVMSVRARKHQPDVDSELP